MFNESELENTTKHNVLNNILKSFGIICISSITASASLYDTKKEKPDYKAIISGTELSVPEKPNNYNYVKPKEVIVPKTIKNNEQKLTPTALYTNHTPQVDSNVEGRSFAQKPVFQGNSEAQSPELVSKYITNKIQDQDILMVKQKKDDLANITNSEDKNIILNNRTSYYDITKSLPEIMNIRLGYSTDLEIVDDLGNKIPIRGFSAGNKPFTLESPEVNMLSFFPTEKYKETNFTIRMEGYNNPIILRIMEGKGNIVDTRVKMVLTSNIKGSGEHDVSFKSNILKELLKTGTLTGHIEKDYEIFDIAKRETAYFNKNLMKVFKISKMGKQYNIILLDSNYEILGEHYSNFNRYQNTLNAYFLQSNRQVFTIMSKVDKIKDNLSFDFIKDIGLVEKYRISIID